MDSWWVDLMESSREDQFLKVLHALFVERPSIAPEKVWLGGGVSSDGGITVLYRGRTGGPVVGRRYDLVELASLFGTWVPSGLAECVWASEIAEPEDIGCARDVDWADGLIDDPSRVCWLNG
jgi:hypothetical protein